MSVLRENMPMISLNSFLALIPIVCGWLMMKTRQKFLQGAFALLWFAFYSDHSGELAPLSFPNG
jgi:uncharacterized membrane protein